MAYHQLSMCMNCDADGVKEESERILSPAPLLR